MLSRAASALSALSAVLAAWYWLRSAQVSTPKEFPIVVDTPVGDAAGGAPSMGALGTGYSVALDELAHALKRQSQLSAVAATCAAISAGLQAAALLL